ncbi:MAG: aldehyde reductase [Steroidobacteraceae bacterium]
MSTILVTGGTGFVAGHALLRLLADGHAVRTTVRHPDKSGGLRQRLALAGGDPAQLSTFSADLTLDAGWAQAVQGCDYVWHVASPFPAAVPRDENDLIGPARDGSLRVLRAARDAGVRRVVLTSSFAAVGYGHPPREAPYTERDWTDAAGPGVTPYIKSKLLAERAAWDFIAREGGGMQLSVVNPVGIFGPVLDGDFASSIAIVRAMLAGQVPACPRVYFGIVDVRDVVDLHLRAMTAPQAAGERFLAVADDCVPLIEVARILRRHLGDAARGVPTRQIPDLLVRAGAWVSPTLRAVLPQLGKMRHVSAARARQVLGWAPRGNDEAVVATAESLLRLGLAGR